MKHLFIGGFADGQWIDVPDEYDYYKVDAYRFADKKDFGYWDNKPIEYHVYQRRRWMTPLQPRYIFVLTTIEQHEVLDILLKGYKCTTSTPSNTPHRTTSSGSGSA